MSVVNDVLRDLDNRKRQHQYAGTIDFMLKDNRHDHSYKPVLKYIILLCIILCSAYVGLYYLNIESNDIGLPYVSRDEKNITTTSDNIIEDSVNKLEILKSDVIYEKDEVVIPTKESPTNDLKSNVISSNTYDEFKKSIIVKNKENKENKEKSKIVNSDISPPELIINKNIRPLYDYAGLLSSDPGAVYPLILKTVPDLLTNKKMLALSAQGEQRSERHSSAINLYTRLISIDNNDPKWKIGAAISYEKENKILVAKKLYLISLKSGKLGPLLKSFVIERISHIDARITNEK